MKSYTIAVTKLTYPTGTTVTKVTGTLKYLKSYFQYDLINGKSWEEESRYKINVKPRSVVELVSNLNKAAHNTLGSRYFYELVE